MNTVASPYDSLGVIDMYPRRSNGIMNVTENVDSFLSKQEMNFINKLRKVMPELAEKFKERLVTLRKNSENKHDMDLQKQICDIQGKKLQYRCDGSGGVISSYGPGVDCETVLHKTNISMNQRFS